MSLSANQSLWSRAGVVLLRDASFLAFLGETRARVGCSADNLGRLAEGAPVDVGCGGLDAAAEDPRQSSNWPSALRLRSGMKGGGKRQDVSCINLAYALMSSRGLDNCFPSSSFLPLDWAWADKRRGTNLWIPLEKSAVFT